MPSRREVDALARALRHISERAQADLGRVFDSLDWSDATTSKQLLVDAIMGISNTYGDAAGAVAAQWVEALLSVEPVLPDRFVREQVEKRVGWSIAKVFSGDVDQARETTKQVVDHIVSSQGKRTVALTCGRHGVRFARVPKGPTTCEFCLMLASRGYVYESASTAGSISSFHASCDCQVVPEDGTVPDGYDPTALYEQWQLVKSGNTKHFTGGGSVTVPSGVNLEPHEIDVADVLARHGHAVIFKKIDNTPGAKNPDAYVDGEVFEFKSPKGSSEKNTISDQFKRGRRQSSRLVLDLRRCGLDDNLAVSQIERRFFGQVRISKMIVIDHGGNVLVYHLPDTM